MIRLTHILHPHTPRPFTNTLDPYPSPIPLTYTLDRYPCLALPTSAYQCLPVPTIAPTSTYHCPYQRLPAPTTAYQCLLLPTSAYHCPYHCLTLPIAYTGTPPMPPSAWLLDDLLDYRIIINKWSRHVLWLHRKQHTSCKSAISYKRQRVGKLCQDRSCIVWTRYLLEVIVHCS